MSLNDEQRKRYSRHLDLPEIGEAGQEKLLESRALIVGAGGLGGTIAYYLAAAGVGTIGLVDGDRVERSNLQRQLLYGEEDIGEPKVKAARDRLLELNSALEINTYAENLTGENGNEIVGNGKYDVLVDGVDNFAARRLINRLSLHFDLPFVHGAVYRFEGEAITFLPGRGPCYGCIFGEEQEAAENPGPFSAAPGVVATIEATETVKYLLDFGDLLRKHLLRIDLRQMDFMTLRVSRDPDCPFCGESALYSENDKIAPVD